MNAPPLAVTRRPTLRVALSLLMTAASFTATVACSDSAGPLGVDAAAGAGGGGGAPDATGAGGADAGSSPPDAGPSGAGAGDAAGCPAQGMGTLAVMVEGLPAGVAPVVTIMGPAGAVPFAASASVAGGSYVITAARVAAPDPIVRRAFVPAVSGSPTCVRAGQTGAARVVYAEIPSSHKLWTGNGNAMTNLLGFASAAVAASGSPPATVGAVAKGTSNLAFDRDGNMWATGDTVADPPLLRIPAAMLGAGGTKTADVTIQSAAFGGGTPRATAIAFDRNGNLWTDVSWAKKIIRFAAAQIAASGSPMPSVEITGLGGIGGMAFDGAGNLWVGDTGNQQIARYDAARLAASTSAAPDLVLVAKSPPPVILTRSNPRSLAFDKEGSLWVSYEGGMVKWPAAELTGTGRKEQTPAIQLGVSVTALPEGIAFDESGGLWFAASQGRFVRLGPDQLTSGGMKTPSTVIASPTVNYARDFAIFPAPAALPLFHSWP
jgi:sugar lactone lactonase YvrE